MYSVEVQKHVVNKENIKLLEVPLNTKCIAIVDNGSFLILNVQKTCYFDWETDTLVWNKGQFLLSNMELSMWKNMPKGPYMEFNLPPGTKYNQRNITHIRVSVQNVICHRTPGVLNKYKYLSVVLEEANALHQLASYSVNFITTQSQYVSFINNKKIAR